MENNSEVRPFTIDIPQADLHDLRDRLARTRWTADLPDVGWSRGVPVSYLRGLAEYWRDGYGWPGSIVEFLHVIGPLTDPRAHDSDPADAFHLVIPSIPGSGFSGPTGEAGWDTNRVTRAFAELMDRPRCRAYGA